MGLADTVTKAYMKENMFAAIAIEFIGAVYYTFQLK